MNFRPYLYKLIKYRAIKVFIKQSQSSVKLLRSVVRHILQLVLPAHCLVLVLSERVVWKDLHSLQHLVALEVLSKRPDILFEVADARHKHISQPEWLSVVLEPLSSLDSLLVAAACQFLVTSIIELLAVKEHEVCLTKQLLDVAVPCASVGVDADVDALLLELLIKREKLQMVSMQMLMPSFLSSS